VSTPMQEPLAPGTYLVLDYGVEEHERVRYPAGSPIPWSEAVRLRLVEEAMPTTSGGGGEIGAPPPSHVSTPGVQTRPPPSRDNPHPRPIKRDPKKKAS
jgi:hypothetical protein